ncbi:hypothetical protein GCM10009555_055840 [Acrocarpospora macrocephala]|uniref:RCC1-like domain-containing protein n=1 Tax=Acrocarpospora macrocephala TaxID=150177 RepID=A0A5M3WR57_9ACTN|nr:RCC1 domain-containing protein [Acrocarpospora macrocephala]GES10599.1 hypothetical protein Amac_041960 [Acrocarpospora macrocephala]
MSSILRRSWLARLAVGTVVAASVVGPAVSAQAVTGTGWSHAAGWGQNQFGEVGDGGATAPQASTPVAVDGAGHGFTKVSAGNGHSVAIGTFGTVWTWGNNNVGQLGDGTTQRRLSPVRVQGLIGVVDVAAGEDFTLAVTSNGAVWAWGNNYAGQLGDGTTQRRFSPVQATALSGVTQVSAGMDFGLALRADGTVWGWGENSIGQLGLGTWTDQPFPAQLPTLTGVDKVDAGYYHALARRTDGTVWGWGYNWDGQVGDGTQISRPLPVLVFSGNALDLSAGGLHSLAIRSDGRLFAWGDNTHGQLGIGTTEGKLRPAKVRDLGLNVRVVSAGYLHSLALLADGTAWASGDNEFGQLGTGSPAGTLIPVQVPGLAAVSGISAGFRHSLAVREVPKPAYTVEIVSKLPRLEPGGSLTAQVVTTALNGSAQQIDLTAVVSEPPPSIAALPQSGVGATVSPKIVTAGDTATLTLVAQPNAPHGTYEVVVTARTPVGVIPAANVTTVFTVEIGWPSS